jgi:hypothetical protein
MTHFRSRILAVAGALVLLAAVLVLLTRPAPPRVAFHLLRYTNDTSGLQALVQMTNSHKDLSYHLHTEVLVDGAWKRSSSQPPFGAFPPYGSYTSHLPGRLPDYNVWIPVPEEGAMWRVELEVWPYQRNQWEQKVIALCSGLRIKYPFAPRTIRGPEFKR